MTDRAIHATKMRRDSVAPPVAAVPVLHRDEWLVAVDKPSGLAVHRGWARESDVLVSRMARQLGTCVHPVHRLDRGTSGVQVLALTAQAARTLGDSFASGAVGKVYWALVRGVPQGESWIDHPLPSGEDKDAPRVSAQTWITPLRRFGRYSLIEARPKTGRLHQIRRHLKHISCPLIGDVNYGKGEHNRLFRERFGLHRIFLHAIEVTLPHPETKQPLTIAAALPPDLTAVLTALSNEPFGNA